MAGSVVPKATIADIRDIPAPCIAGAAQITSDALWWIGCDLPKQPPTAQIVQFQRSSGTTAVWHQAARTGSGISLLHVSDSWITWVEYSDLRAASDAQLYARPRSGGPALLLDDASSHSLVTAIDTALDGAEAYWTLPVVENGVWHGVLMHRHLPDGVAEVTARAPMGAVLGWPSALGNTLAYEVNKAEGSPRTQIIIRAGAESHLLEVSPASEPALGTGFLAFKRADRFTAGDLATLRFSDGKVMALGPGEGPVALDAFVTWKSTDPADAALHVARPLIGCDGRVADNPESRQSFPVLGPRLLAWTFRDPQLAGLESARLRYASLLLQPNDPCPAK